MSVQFNHTIVYARDKDASASFFAEILGLPHPATYGPFRVVELDNGASLDFLDDRAEVVPQHYAFLVSEPQFDEILDRIKDRNIEYYADPAMARPGEINTNDGGRGVYWRDSNGHMLEAITVPYGGWS